MSIKEVLTNIFVVKRFPMEKYITAKIEDIYKLIELIITHENTKDLKHIVSQVLQIEVEYNNNHEKFIALAKSSDRYPFYWRDIYAVGSCLDKIFQLTNNYYNKRLNCDYTFNSSAIFSLEKKILDNITAFLQSYLENPQFISELLKNNKAVIKQFSICCNEFFDQEKCDFYMFEKYLEIRFIFEQIYSENEDIHSLMSKISIGPF